MHKQLFYERFVERYTKANFIFPTLDAPFDKKTALPSRTATTTAAIAGGLVAGAAGAGLFMEYLSPDEVADVVSKCRKHCALLGISVGLPSTTAFFVIDADDLSNDQLLQHNQLLYEDICATALGAKKGFTTYQVRIINILYVFSIGERAASFYSSSLRKCWHSDRKRRGKVRAQVVDLEGKRILRIGFSSLFSFIATHFDAKLFTA